MENDIGYQMAKKLVSEGVVLAASEGVLLRFKSKLDVFQDKISKYEVRTQNGNHFMLLESGTGNIINDAVDLYGNLSIGLNETGLLEKFSTVSQILSTLNDSGW